MIYKWWSGLTTLFIPRLCLGCRQNERPENQVICFACESDLPITQHWEVQNNGFTDRLMGRFPFQTGGAMLFFTPGGVVQQLIHELKYNRQQIVGEYLGKNLGRKLKNSPYYKGVEVIVPVPLTAKRKSKRGYNQSEILADGISATLGVPVLSNVLRRIDTKESQTKMGREERLKDIMTSFRLGDTDAIKGRHLLLVDDVLTTGATLDACCQCLLEGQPASIRLVTLAMAVNY